ncbi:Gnk2-homologous domain [Dillenia turbinata]|uniref:Gnk2-homologous domain n=1 Tax=Dillenia turbinata TaxID=194707 RepID=A0AAN8ZF33_9MAGN
MAINSSKQTLFLLFSLLHLVAISISQPDFLYSKCMDDYGNYTSNSTCKQNLDKALSNSYGNGYRFFNVSVGENIAKVNAIALCRGDVELASCRSCQNNSNYKLRLVFTNRKEAFGGDDNCMSSNDTSNVNGFNQELGSLLNKLKNQAASGGSLRKYATGNASFGNFQTIYGLVQCTPDLTEIDCSNCVDSAKENIQACCGGKEGGRVIYPSCYIRYETCKFYNSDPTTGTETVISAILLIIMITFYIRKTEQKVEIEDDNVDNVDTSMRLCNMTFETVKQATENFSDANKLGQGGFGAVYKVINLRPSHDKPRHIEH